MDGAPSTLNNHVPPLRKRASALASSTFEIEEDGKGKSSSKSSPTFLPTRRQTASTSVCVFISSEDITIVGVMVVVGATSVVEG